MAWIRRASSLRKCEERAHCQRTTLRARSPHGSPLAWAGTATQGENGTGRTCTSRRSRPRGRVPLVAAGVPPVASTLRHPEPAHVCASNEAQHGHQGRHDQRGNPLQCEQLLQCAKMPAPRRLDGTQCVRRLTVLSSWPFPATPPRPSPREPCNGRPRHHTSRRYQNGGAKTRTSDSPEQVSWPHLYITRFWGGCL